MTTARSRTASKLHPNCTNTLPELHHWNCTTRTVPKFAPKGHQHCTRTKLHKNSGKIASGPNQNCTRTASEFQHQNCASIAPELHQNCTRTAPDLLLDDHTLNRANCNLTTTHKSNSRPSPDVIVVPICWKSPRA